MTTYKLTIEITFFSDRIETNNNWLEKHIKEIIEDQSEDILPTIHSVNVIAEIQNAKR